MKKNLLSVLILLAANIISLRSLAQTICGPYGPTGCPCLTITNQTFTSCPGVSTTVTPVVTVPAGYTVNNFSWSPTTTVVPAAGTGLPGVTVITPPLLAPTSCTRATNLYTLSVSATSPNEIMNPDFSLGGLDYCYSTYTYITTPPLSYVEETVCADASVFEPGATPFFDHTTYGPGGAMLMAYADPNSYMVWEQKLNTCVGELYSFSFFFADVDMTGTTTDLQVLVNGTPIGSVSTSATFSWLPTGGALPAFTATSAVTTISIVNNGSDYNYFAIDDISFTHTCVATGTVKIVVDYPVITGTNTPICPGSTLHLTGCTPDTWTSSTTSVATVTSTGAGVVTGVAPGTSTITMADGDGCTATTVVTVSPGPVISGPASVCAGSNFTFTSSTMSGTWSSTGHVTGSGTGTSQTFTASTTAGTGTVTCLGATGCSESATVTVLQGADIRGPVTVCQGQNIVLTGYIAPTGTTTLAGNWTATSGLTTTGVTTGTSSVTYTAGAPGTSTVTLTNPSTGCMATTTITINPGPIISGPTSVCAGSSFTFSSSGSTGTWSSTGHANGSSSTPSASFTYTATNTPGPGTVTCTNPTDGCAETVDITVLAGAFIFGPSSTCAYVDITYTGSASASGTPVLAGNWGSGSGLIPITGTSGVSTVTYYADFPASTTVTFTNPTTGCSTTKNVTIKNTPTPIATQYLCDSYTYNLNLIPPSPTGGTWTPASGSVATITAGTGSAGGGRATGTAPGSEIITYTLPDGCFTTTELVVENCGGGGGLIGSDLMCYPETQTFTVPTGVATGGSWTCAGSAGGTVTSTGAHTGSYTPAGAGTETITYTPPGGATSWTITVTVGTSSSACVEELYSATAGYSFEFTSTCLSGATIYYQAYDATGAVLTGSTTPPYTIVMSSTTETLPYSYFEGIFGPNVVKICVYEVACGFCTNYASCCATVNPVAPRLANTDLQTTNASEGAETLTIIPNPNSGSFTLTGFIKNAPASAQTNLEIVDMLGKVVYTDAVQVNQGIINKNITLSPGFAEGIYLVRIKNGTETKVIRFVLQH